MKIVSWLVSAPREFTLDPFLDMRDLMNHFNRYISLSFMLISFVCFDQKINIKFRVISQTQEDILTGQWVVITDITWVIHITTKDPLPEEWEIITGTGTITMITNALTLLEKWVT